MVVPFDQYQRYETLGSVVKKIKERYACKQVKILEIGANEQRNLEKFLPDEDIYYSDIQLPEELLKDPKFFIADATNLENLKDDEFDVVVAGDVFEHIPKDLRRDFLKETSRVAKYATVLCFPFNAPHVAQAEVRCNEYFKTICGKDYIWLEEHIENGLPDVQLIDEYLKDAGICFSRFEHGDIRIWEEMTKCHFYTCFVQELIPYREEIDRYYSNEVYAHDRTDRNYRNFYILYKNREEQEFFDELAEKYFRMESDGQAAAGYESVKKLCKEVKEIFELRQRIWLQQYEMGVLRPGCDMKQDSLANQGYSVYFDMGEGYTQAHMKDKAALESQQPGTRDCVRIVVPEGCKGLRFDPLEGCQSVLKNVKILTSQGICMNYNTNGMRYGEYLVFASDDPQIILDLEHLQTGWVQIEAEVYLMDGFSIQHMMLRMMEIDKRLGEELKDSLDSRRSLQGQLQGTMQEYQRTVEEKKALQDDNAGKDARIAELELLYQNALRDYNGISGAFTWRMTKPLRVCMDGTKKLLKKNKYTRKMGRGVKCLKQNGFRYTCRRTGQKVKGKLGKTPQVQTPQQPVVTTQMIQEFENSIQLEPISEELKFSILVPLYNTDEHFLRLMIESVLSQRYSNWELCLADGSTPECAYVGEVCRSYAQNDSRIHYKKLERNLGISENTNACAAMATGEYIVLFDHDDTMSSLALYENARAIYATDADVLYSDEDHVTEDERHVFPLYKPDWSRDLLYTQMYVCHLFVFKKSLFEKVGGFRSEFDGSQDYDLMLRFSEQTERILHIPKCLYSWRESSTSTASNAASKPYAHFAGLNALNDHLQRTYGGVAHANETENTFVFETRFDTMKNQPLVSIIMPMKDHYELSRDCVNSILQKSTYQNYEILILDNRSEKPETFAWFEQVQRQDSRIRVIRADFEFNWSKLNNYGMDHANGEVYIFLNNDIVVISPDWIERLCENALRDDVGVVGPMLLFEDNTIQHAGVVVGFGGWADHIFRGMAPVHHGSPFISPVLSRNVSAVTGACMVISKNTIEKIGRFDDSFIITGSDVEICIRAYEMGLNNLYNSRARLYHLESKSRDPRAIPEIDFKRSYECYTPYREYGDPYYNINLDYNSYQPMERGDKMNLVDVRNYLKKNRFTGPIGRKVKNFIVGDLTQKTPNTKIPEIEPIHGRAFDAYGDTMRLNILSPSVDKAHVFGGIATALKFFESLASALQCPVRIIVTDAPVVRETSVKIENYTIVDCAEDSFEARQVVPFCDRAGRTFPVGKNDIFMATGWWTAYNIPAVMQEQAEHYNQPVKPLLYMIQDYEPGFYSWSSRYLMADSTYKLDVPTVAIFNSRLLEQHFEVNGYEFAKSYSFDPVLNDSLKEYLFAHEKDFKRKKQILIYGRPSVERNALELIVAALTEWASKQKNVEEWTVLSAGEDFGDIPVGEHTVIHSVGKLSLEEYAQTMLETSIGISLMVSPHPSYPPLEMSTFGVRTITNCYGSKDLASFNDNIVSIKNCSQTAICNKLLELCDTFSEEGSIGRNEQYLSEDVFDDIVKDLADYLRK